MLVFTAFQTMSNIEVSDNKATHNYMFLFCCVRALPRIFSAFQDQLNDRVPATASPINFERNEFKVQFVRDEVRYKCSICLKSRDLRN